jgi:hypothetical protein
LPFILSGVQTGINKKKGFIVTDVSQLTIYFIKKQVGLGQLHQVFGAVPTIVPFNPAL